MAASNTSLAFGIKAKRQRLFMFVDDEGFVKAQPFIVQLDLTWHPVLCRKPAY